LKDLQITAGDDCFACIDNSADSVSDMLIVDPPTAMAWLDSEQFDCNVLVGCASGDEIEGTKSHGPPLSSRRRRTHELPIVEKPCQLMERCEGLVRGSDAIQIVAKSNGAPEQGALDQCKLKRTKSVVQSDMFMRAVYVEDGDAAELCVRSLISTMTSNDAAWISPRNTSFENEILESHSGTLPESAAEMIAT
jgi:hypothetical protein